VFDAIALDVGEDLLEEERRVFDNPTLSHFPRLLYDFFVVVDHAG